MAGARSNSLGLALLIAALPLCAAAAELTVGAGGSLRTGRYLWQAAAEPGQMRIVIDRAQQRAYVYQGELLIGVSTVSTGKKGHRTPLGTFTILQKAARHRSNKYSNAPMPFMQRLTWDGIALHAGHLPGYPASHGCIRLPWSFAQKLFAATSLGVIVEVIDGGSPLPRVQMAAAPDPATPAPPPPLLAIEVPPATTAVTLASAAVPPAAAAPPAAAPAPVAVAVAAPSAPARPIVLALADPPRPIAPARPPRVSWLEQSADDFVTWGTKLPTRGGYAGSR